MNVCHYSRCSTSSGLMVKHTSIINHFTENYYFLSTSYISQLQISSLWPEKLRWPSGKSQKTLFAAGVLIYCRNLPGNRKWFYTTENVIMNIIFHLCQSIPLNPKHWACNEVTMRLRLNEMWMLTSCFILIQTILQSLSEVKMELQQSEV